MRFVPYDSSKGAGRKKIEQADHTDWVGPCGEWATSLVALDAAGHHPHPANTADAPPPPIPPPTSPPDDDCRDENLGVYSKLASGTLSRR